MGRSWTAVALSLPQNATLYAVDTFWGEDSEPLKYVEKHGPVLKDFVKAFDKVQALRPDLKLPILPMYSKDAAAFVPDKGCDVVFVDGNHQPEAVRIDFQFWKPKVKPGGLFCGHDISELGVRLALRGESIVHEWDTMGSIWCLK